MHCLTITEWKSVHKRLDDLENTVKDLKSKLELSGNGNQNLNLDLETQSLVVTNRLEINTPPNLISVGSDVVVNLPDSDEVFQESLTLTSEANIFGLKPAPTSSRILTNASESTSIMESNTENVLQGRASAAAAASSSSFSIPSGIGIHDQNAFEKSRRAIISLRRCDESQVLAMRPSIELRDEQNRENHSTARTVKCTRAPRVARKLASSSSHENNGRGNGSSVRVGEKQKRYKCPICSRKFTAKYKLTNHVRVHTGEKPYTCHVCEKRYPIKDSLRVHLRLHTGNKPYTCRFCAKLFNGSNNLKIHLRVHTGEKPYQCQFCSKCFSQQTSLAVHTRIHTGEKPYKCQFCTKTFRAPATFAYHLRTHRD